MPGMCYCSKERAKMAVRQDFEKNWRPRNRQRVQAGSVG